MPNLPDRSTQPLFKAFAGLPSRLPRLSKTAAISTLIAVLYIASGLPMPWWGTAFIWFMLWLCIAYVVAFSELTERWPVGVRALASLVAAIVVIVIGNQGVRDEYQSSKLAEKPEVTLRFVYPDIPSLVIVNQSGVVAKDIKWMVVLWNLDEPNQTNPFPIPTSTFDWVEAYSSGGPEELFTQSMIAGLHPGNRLIGSASVNCPECARGHTFVVSIVWGHGGWFSELESMKTGEVLIPRRLTKPLIEQFAKSIASTPNKSRISITTHWQ